LLASTKSNPVLPPALNQNSLAFRENNLNKDISHRYTTNLFNIDYRFQSLLGLATVYTRILTIDLFITIKRQIVRMVRAIFQDGI